MWASWRRLRSDCCISHWNHCIFKNARRFDRGPVKSGLPATGGVSGKSPYLYQKVVFLFGACFLCVFKMMQYFCRKCCCIDLLLILRFCKLAPYFCQKVVACIFFGISWNRFLPCYFLFFQSELMGYVTV